MAIDQVKSTEVQAAVAALVLDYKVVPIEGAVNMLRASDQELYKLLLDYITKADLLKIISKELGMEYYDAHAINSTLKLDLNLFNVVDIAFCKQYSALPLRDSYNNIVVAVAMPLADINTYFLKKFNRQFSYALAESTQIQDSLAKVDADLTAQNFSKNISTQTVANRVLPTIANTAQVTRGEAPEFVTAMLTRAVTEGASDIHIEFDKDKNLIIRFRIDGLRKRLDGFPPVADRRKNEIINRIISLCEDTMKSTDLFMPQDGTFSFTTAGRTIDARVALLPQINGPRLVIRLLDSRTLFTRLDDMGFSVEDLSIMRRHAGQPSGTILVTGPTGSGKSTTVYGLLRELDAETKAILTVEDPVEYRLAGIGQTPIRSDLGERSITFEKAFRSILRSDPDIILIGEIRDAETARTAMQASITGHLVFSTIHATSAVGVFTRIIEMDIEPYLPANSITLTISQRLARKLHECKVIEKPSAAEISWFANQNVSAPDYVAHQVGCEGCNNTGFRGRQAIVELLEPTYEFKNQVLGRKSDAVLRETAVANGFRPIILDALNKVNSHTTTVSEIARVLDS